MRKLIASILIFQSKRLLKKTKAKVIVVTGSVGKTSTTQAIAHVLSKNFTVQRTLKNYNTDVGVPCSMFNRPIPSHVNNPFAWLLVIFNNELSLLSQKQVDVFVLELGTDKIGEIASFSWLKPDIAVVTAIAPEHMEFFETLDNVAKEELSVANYSKEILVNKNIDAANLKQNNLLKKVQYYSSADLTAKNIDLSRLQVVGLHSHDALAAAMCVGNILGLETKLIELGIQEITPQPGRMQILKGLKNSTLIDDTYNASPLATRAALDFVYTRSEKIKIVLLGNMNELGESSAREHRTIGEYCDPKKLQLVVTLGPDANMHLAAAARQKGCKVIEVRTPYEAAEAIKPYLIHDALVLLKGSQNGVYAEEATKELLANPEDKSYLVRQSDDWLRKKRNNFKGF